MLQLPRILKYVQELHQYFQFHTSAMLDHSRLTNLCEAGFISYCCDKNLGFHGSDHEQQKILIGKYANIFWRIVRRWSTATNSLHVYIFSWLNLLQATCHHLRNEAKNWSQICGTFIFMSCYGACESKLSWVDGVLTGYFPILSTEWIAIKFQNSAVTCIALFSSLF